MRTSTRWCALGATTILLCGSAAAQETPPSDDTGLTPEEQAEFDAAAEADAAAAPPAPGVGPTAAGGRQSLNPDISVITDFGLAWFAGGERLEGGEHDLAENGFHLQAMEIAIAHAVDPYFRFEANLLVSDHGLEIEEVYATTLALPHKLQVRAGHFLTRFGRQNTMHPHQWDFVDQPFALTRAFGGEGNRGPGLELSWLSPLPWYAELVVAATDARGEETARSFLASEEAPPEDPSDLQWTATALQFFELGPDWSLQWGLSTATAPNTMGGRTVIGGTDIYLKYRPISRQSDTIVSLQSEWLVRWREVSGGSLTDLTGYAQVFWRFAGRWGTAARWEYGGAASASGGGIVADELDPEWTGDRHRASLAFTFWPTEFSHLRLQGGADFPSWQDDPTWMVGLSAEFVVGAHGAHKF